jgi:hypothetical protein
MRKRSSIMKFLIRVFRLWRRAGSYDMSYTPIYRVINIVKNDCGNYKVTIQMIGKGFVQKISPEELLSDDKMVNLFSPTDIRTLTYLGYLDINSPQYKILAKRLSEDHDQTLFALHKKGEKNYKVLTANEISKDINILKNLTQEEAYMLGMTTAHEQHMLEQKQKVELLSALNNDKNSAAQQ